MKGFRGLNDPEIIIDIIERLIRRFLYLQSIVKPGKVSIGAIAAEL